MPAARAHRAVEPHVDGDVDPRAAHRPRPRAHPLVRALAARRAERHRRGAADRGLRAPLDAAGARSRRDARRVALGADLAGRAPAPARAGGPRATGTDRISVRGDVGTRRVDLLRRQAAVGAAGRPARRTTRARSTYDWEPLDEELEVLGHPRLQRHRHVAASGRVPLGAALRRLPRRHVRAREPRRAQPHAPRRPRRPEAARARASRRRSSSSSRRRRGSSSPATACASRSPARTGRTRGRRRRPARSRSTRASVELELPGARRPARRAAPVFQPPPTGERRRRVRRRSSRPSSGASSRTRSGGRRGSSRATATATTAPYGAKIEEQYDGLVGVADSNPGRAWASARARYAIAWPEATVRHRGAPRPPLRRRAAYHVVVEVVASEDGPDGIGHVERRFERTIPRRLQ